MLDIIFLAPDRALCSAESLFTARGDRINDKMDVGAIRLLDAVCQATKAKVVICGPCAELTSSAIWWTNVFRSISGSVIPVVSRTATDFGRGIAVLDWLQRVDAPIDRHIIFDSKDDYKPTQPVLAPPAGRAITVAEAIRGIQLITPNAEILKKCAQGWPPAPPVSTTTGVGK